MKFPTKGVVAVTLCGALFAIASSSAQAQCRSRGGMSTMTNPMLQSQFGFQPNMMQAQQLVALAQLQALQQQIVLQAQLQALQQRPGSQAQPFGLQANANQQVAQAQNPVNGARAQNLQTSQRKATSRPAQKAVAKKPLPKFDQADDN